MPTYGASPWRGASSWLPLPSCDDYEQQSRRRRGRRRKLSQIRGSRSVDDVVEVGRPLLLLATRATLAKCGPTAAFVFARVFAADGSKRPVANGIGLFANAEFGRVSALFDVAPGG
jgi:hypothetical protein